MGRRRQTKRPGLVEDPTGVWSVGDKAAEVQRRGAQQAAAAQAAMQEMQQRVDEILNDPELTPNSGCGKLNLLRTSGYSEEESRLLFQAQEQARREYVQSLGS